MTSRMASDDGTLHSISFLLSSSSFTVRNSASMPILPSGHTSLPTPSGISFDLHNVLVVPSIVRNLLCVRKFTRDNSCSIEFDYFGFSIKDLRTKSVILCCNSDRELQTLFPTATPLSSPH